MQLLFHHKYKRPSGWLFYISLPLGIYSFLTGKFDEYLVLKVYPIFSFSKEIETDRTINIIGSEGFQWIENGFINEILIALIIIAGIVNSFSKEAKEDELIAKYRTESLTLSLYLNYGMVLLATFLIYELTFLYVLVFNLFSILLIFNLLFKYRLYQHYRD